MRILLIAVFLCAVSCTAFAQLGAGRPDISWYEFDTPHFTIVYHEGLDSVAREAARVAEAMYPVVTGNLGMQVSGRTPIYLSDLDAVPNAFAYSDDYVYIWLRGILDDMPLGGVRSGGRAKWLRTVITHEFTHTAIAHATKSWMSEIFPSPGVPRWFNEGTARFMEPDGWTTDLDMVLRVAAVNARLEYFGLDRLSGHLLYETGHSIVRYMTWRFGDSVLGRILSSGRSWTGQYDFDDAVKEATGESMGDIYSDWLRHVTVLYGANYGVREEAVDITPPLTKKVSFADGVRFSPDGSRLALLGSSAGQWRNLVVLEHPSGRFTGDSGAVMRVLSGEAGFDNEFSWSPDGTKLVLSKRRFGSHRALVHDLYTLDVGSGELTRLTDDGALTDPAWSPDGKTIAAVYKRMGRDQLVLVDPATGARRPLTSFTGDVQIYTPAWSPDGTQLAFSMFGEDGRRSIAVMSSSGGSVRSLTADTVNNRYPVWSPDGRRLAFTSHENGIPNIQVMNSDGSDRHYITDMAGGVYSVQWKPGSDSVLVISFDSRSRIYPHLFPASRTVTPTSPPVIRDKYTAWRRVALPLQVPPEEQMPAAVITGEGPYSSLANIALTQILPLISSDEDVNDAWNARWQLLTRWNDPMGIHDILGFIDLGGSPIFREPGAYASYTNNWLPVSVQFYGGSLYGFSGIIDSVHLYERRRTGGLSFSYTLPAPNSLTAAHTFSLGGEYRSLEPGNIQNFTGTDLVPVRARLAELTAGYMFSSNDLFVDLRYRRSSRGLGATHEFDRVTATAEWGLVLNPWTYSQFVVRAEGTALWGEQIAQEFVGLDAYDQFEGAFNLLWLKPNHRVRGVRRYMYGDRVFVGSVGLRQPFESGVPMAALLFAELGTAWNADRPLGDLTFVRGYGIELQLDFFDDFKLTGGLAFEMKSRARRDLYVRVVRGL